MRVDQIRGLMEAYSQVHGTSEDINEEVENWLNSLVEEGYDLSGYTSDELYEAYIEEKEGIFNNDITRGLSRAAAGVGNYAKSLFGPLPTAKPKPAMPGLPSSARQVTQYPAGVPTGVGGGNAGGSRSDTKPAATKPAATKPAATKPAVTRPAATTSVGKPTGGSTTPARASSPATASTADKIKGGMDVYNKQKAAGDLKGASETGKSVAALANPQKPKTPNPLMQKTFGYQTGNSPKDQQTRADKIVQSGAVKALAPTTAAKPSTSSTPSLQQSIRNRRLNMDLDVFDLVKGYLLDEGYAETEEGAIVMMVNMSEGWRESILESCGVELELDESQHARENPEEYERSPEAKEGRRRRSGINDPDTGINSDKFKAFMAQQMGGKKKKG